MKYKSVDEMYGKDDLGNNPIFPGGFINYGYWKNIYKPGDKITPTTRINASINLYKEVLSKLNMTDKDILLEIACGKGYGLKMIHEVYKPKQLLAIDASSYQVDRSKSNTKDINTIRIIQSKAEEIPFKNDSVTKIVSVEALQHFQDIKQFVVEAGRVLKKGGALSLCTFFAPDDKVSTELADMFPTIKAGIDHAVNINWFKSQLEMAGFSDITITSIGNYVWEPFVKWCQQVQPKQKWSVNWLKAFEKRMLDYYIVCALR